MFEAYLAKDQRTAVGLLADDFVFTSPQDDHFDKTAFMQRCFPNAARLVSQEILELAAVSNDGVFILCSASPRMPPPPRSAVTTWRAGACA